MSEHDEDDFEEDDAEVDAFFETHGYHSGVDLDDEPIPPFDAFQRLPTNVDLASSMEEARQIDGPVARALRKVVDRGQVAALDAHFKEVFLKHHR